MSRTLEVIRCWRLLALIVLVLQLRVAADPVAVRNPEGTLHGFLALTTEDGHVLADGDLIQVVRGDLVTSHIRTARPS